jgi:U3 small nucleolar ribonucleoprotein protein IMP3
MYIVTFIILVTLAPNQWKQDQGHRDAQVMAMYHVQNRDDYHKYNKICGQIRQLAQKLSQLSPQDPVRLKHEELLLEKLSNLGVFPPSTKPKVSDLENKVTVAAFCRRRLPVVICRLKMAPNVSEATKFIEQGHVRVGPQVITDPAFLVTRNMEDFITWVDSSKIKRNILKYRNQVDDFELM